MLTYADVCWHAGGCSSKASSFVSDDTDTREQHAQHAREQEEDNGRRNTKEARGLVDKRGNDSASKESGSKESGSKESGSKESGSKERVSSSCSDRRSAHRSPFRETTRAGGRRRDAAGWES